jgi:hypothetical protein
LVATESKSLSSSTEQDENNVPGGSIPSNVLASIIPPSETSTNREITSDQMG